MLRLVCLLRALTFCLRELLYLVTDEETCCSDCKYSSKEPSPSLAGRGFRLGGRPDLWVQLLQGIRSERPLPAGPFCESCLSAWRPPRERLLLPIVLQT